MSDVHELVVEEHTKARSNRYPTESSAATASRGR